MSATSSLNILDRVARSILKARFYDYDPESYGCDLERFFEELDDEHMYNARDEAREAIKAMADPTPDMIAAGWQAVSVGKKVSGIARLGPGPGLVDGYRAMIASVIAGSNQCPDT